MLFVGIVVACKKYVPLRAPACNASSDFVVWSFLGVFLCFVLGPGVLGRVCACVCVCVCVCFLLDIVRQPLRMYASFEVYRSESRSTCRKSTCLR